MAFPEVALYNSATAIVLMYCLFGYYSQYVATLSRHRAIDQTVLGTVIRDIFFHYRRIY